MTYFTSALSGRCWLRVGSFAVVCLCLGCDDGTVAVKGRVSLEGKPVTNGRLSMSPIGGGPRAFAMVDQSGAFELRSADSIGACPGEYRVSFRQKVDKAAKAQLARQLAGRSNVGELTVIFEGPYDKPVTVPEQGVQDLEIDIRMKEGWTPQLSE